MDDSFRYFGRRSRRLPRDDALAARQLSGPVKATGKAKGLKESVEEDLRPAFSSQVRCLAHHAVNSASLSGFGTGGL